MLDVAFARQQLVHLALVDVVADGLETHLDERLQQRQPHVTQPDHADQSGLVVQLSAIPRRRLRSQLHSSSVASLLGARQINRGNSP